MYQSHFHLNGRPFASAPNPEHYFPASNVENAREALVQSVERSVGVVLLSGGVGTGKSLLCQLVANHFVGELPVCMLSSARICDRQMLLQSILHHLGLPFRNLNEGELRLMLADHIAGPSCPGGLLLIIDEADRLSMKLLEEVRVITNLVHDGQPQVRLVLAGGPRLEERVGHPKMESLNQRVVRRLYLDNFSSGETADYIRARITACGADSPSLFTDAAVGTVHQATSGIPRLINQLCDHALILAAVNAQDQLDRDDIEDAWADLQRLPRPQRAHAPVTGSDHDEVVEFGTLEETELPPADVSQQIEMIENQMDAYDDAPQDELLVDVSGEIEIEESEEEEESPDSLGGQFVESYTETETETTSVDFEEDNETHDETHDELEATEEELEEDEEQAEQIMAKDDSEICEPIAEEDEVTGIEQIELTIEHAANPFDEEFAEEEIVLQAFVSPLVLAGPDNPQVSSAYSHDLARRLTAVQPPLKMHLAEPPEQEGEVEPEYQPLSAFLEDDVASQAPDLESCHDEESVILEAAPTIEDPQDSSLSDLPQQPVEAEPAEYLPGDDVSDRQVIIQFDPTRFDPREDPVMPEFNVGVEQVMVEHIDASEFADLQRAANAGADYEGTVRMTESDQDQHRSPPLDQSQPRQERKPRAFRQLFSKMRRA